MLMRDDKKKAATLIIAKMKKGDKMGKAPEMDGAEQSDADELSMIADEIMQAIEKKDISALRDGLKSMVECCMNEEPESEEMESSEEEED